MPLCTIESPATDCIVLKRLVGSPAPHIAHFLTEKSDLNIYLTSSNRDATKIIGECEYHSVSRVSPGWGLAKNKHGPHPSL